MSPLCIVRALCGEEINGAAPLIAFAALTFAYSTESVNDVPGKKVPGRAFTLPEPAGPEGTFTGDAAGLSHRATQ